MPRQDDPASGGGKKRGREDSQASLSTDALGDPRDSERSDISPSPGDPEIANDPVDDPLVETTDDPDSTSDTILTPGSPSEYDRQRDARPNRDGDNWATDTTGR